MATICQSDLFTVCTSGNKIGAFRPDVDPVIIEVARTTDNVQIEAKKEGCDGPGSDQIFDCKFSRSGTYLAVCDDYKQLSIYKTGNEASLLSNRALVRRCSSVVFTKDEKTLLCGDKSGDVYAFSVVDPQKPGQLILGHLSMLLDLVIVKDDQFLVTCDRDEKIRISHYPNTHSIHTYCLGHTEFVSRLLYIEETEILVSGAGDGTIRFWSLDGCERNKIECSVQCSEIVPTVMQSTGDGKNDAGTDHVTVKCFCYSSQKSTLIAAYDGYPCIHLFHLTFENSSVQSTFISEFPIKHEFWDMTLGHHDVLWMLTGQDGGHASVYAVNRDGSGGDDILTAITEESEGPGEKEACMVASRINVKAPEFFKASLNVRSVYAGLVRPKIDNMKAYLERKNQRIGKRKPNAAEVKPPKLKQPKEIKNKR